ncbi:MAG: beta-galactosidase, partial [Acidobacteriia bacterium]|nr:beta-galactosidase [Terriglobia bacterium]
MRYFMRACLFILIACSCLYGKVVVFMQEGFPAVDSRAVPQDALRRAFDGQEMAFVNGEELSKARALAGADLLVLPYGSAFPADDWRAIREYLEGGGCLLNIGGRPFFVPVRKANGKFEAGPPENAYARFLGFQHSYVAPQKDAAKFAWAEGYDFFHATELRASKVFVLGHGWDVPSDYRGLGFLLNARGEKVAAPVVAQDFSHLGEAGEARLGARGVYLNFEPEEGYWSSTEGVALIRDAAAYARQGATQFSLAMRDTTLAPGEIPRVEVHFRNARRQRLGQPQTGSVRVELVAGENVLASAQVKCSADTVTQEVAFQKTLSPGLYRIRGIYESEEHGAPGEFYETGFWVRDESLLRSGPRLGVSNSYFTLDGAPFLPFGTNYFSTDRYSHDLIAPGNAAVWDRDFAEMEKHGVTFIRTGVWNNHIEIIDPVTGAANEHFLGNLEAFLLSAGRHHIQVHFTFFAFDPQTIKRHPGEESLLRGPGSNPYTDPVAIRAEQNYILSVVRRFADVPYLSWDLINEPSFSNPQRLWIGNTPNNDPTEVAAWNRWLEERYGSVEKLAEAWGARPEELGSFGNIALPDPGDLRVTRYGNAREARAFDYNLFAQAMFGRWVEQMVAAIRSTGSRQLVTVGQDEGGVTDRVLGQFFGGTSIDFTVNHTYWRDDALLWDSVAAKRPGKPNLIGETGYQPVWRPDSQWRYDELTGFGLLERKLALGFAAANSGSLQWDWSEGDIFGIKRSDGSDKIWENMLREMGDFARKAATYASEPRQPEVAIVLPQSLQLSVFNSLALEAQQTCVRALYQYARATAYVVGEYQTQLLGNPKLVIMPSPWVFDQKAWEAILEKVRGGATLLLSGAIDWDAHFHATPRLRDLGMDARSGLLSTRENLLQWPGGKAWLSYSGEKTTFLERGFLPGGQTFATQSLGKGTILYVPLPLELNDNLKAIGNVYADALRRLGINAAYTTDIDDPGVLICPTEWKDATLY